MTPARALPGQGEGARPYSHLLPVLDAELEWGNASLGPFSADPDGWWAVTLSRPLHVDRLREAFDFPGHVQLGRNGDGTTYVVDADNRVRIVAPGGHGPRRPRRGVLSRALGW